MVANATSPTQPTLRALARGLVAWCPFILALLSGATGCQTISLPAIDPSGNRLFDPNRPLTFVSPHDPNNGYPSTAPAFQTPPTPPRCVQTGEKKLCKGCLSGKGCVFGKKQEAEEMRGRCGDLLITPNRLVAPVGGEVVLLAGICGTDDHLVTNEPIEWMLAPDSVGQIVEVGDDAKGQRQSFWKPASSPKVEKLGIDFARGRTSNAPGIITKGTADRSDDLPIRKGQTWVSLTSPSEGVSKVTVLAPESDVWNKRRQTATIYWIDVSWDFPLPQVITNDAPARLATKVTRSEGFVAAKDWIVRYRSLNPEFAQFVLTSTDPTRPGEQLKDSVDAIVDQNGIAYVYLKRLENAASGVSLPKNGSALVEVEVVRPQQPGENMPELSLARGTTSVTWNAPELVLDALGPDIGSPGQSLQYFVKVSNIGGLPAENVVLTATIPNGMTIDGTSYPPHRKAAQSLIWEIGPLDARRVFEVSIQATPTTDMDARVVFDLLAAPSVKQQKTVPTLIQKAAVSLQFAPKANMAQAPVNGDVVFDCVLTNNGNQALQSVRIQIDSRPGLVHKESGDVRVIRDFPILRPGERQFLEPVFFVQQPGDYPVTASLYAMGQLLASQTTTVRGFASSAPGGLANPNTIPGNSPPSTGPGSVLPGGLNNGALPSAPLPNGGLPSGALPGGGLPSGALPGGGLPGGGLPSGELPSSPTPGSSAPGMGLPTAPGGLGLPGSSARPAIGSGVASDERLNVSVQPLVQLIKQGDTVAYELRVENRLQQPDQKVAISLQIPKECKLQSVRALGLDYRVVEGTGVVELTPIQFFRPRDAFTIVFQLKHEVRGSQQITVSAQSRNQPEPVSSSINVSVQ
ncbi:hypothetical protein VN12_13710 [Pirellula sp. SH-Sr6A]|uniref:hypothetical protein n=1 Tax=Pirellula sp. SH-Sr6A TaxID=1632865 RepID=UPI00078C3122|nr:hypothetical protein [Pirellula sp. SH-Sr6A]AMV33177.1 hypothetical protein VN12_13710 [Pirellula sp. SH-Sr6A]